MKRIDNRAFDQLRKIAITRSFNRYAEGSCLVEFGNTKVICTASVDKTVPPFLRNSGTGWVTAEYGMLPRSTHTRVPREKNAGRTQEIQRLIGRSLRSIISLKELGERTILIDCDVMQADGGTRIASIIGGFVALVDAVVKISKDFAIPMCITDYLGAVSVGLWKGNCVLDLNFEEDSRADVDMNVVMKGCGDFIEIQGTGEHTSFTQDDLDSMLALAKKGITEIIDIERNLLKDVLKI
ncbi:MAG: ribonuclease PH [Candidatus Omnitrophica bacterium]|nr:ribonuclease PH [Candidatus Omnitrophota bacterium]